MKKYVSLYSLILVIGMMGCSSPEKRAEELPEAFRGLTKKQQAKVLRGEIEEGFTQDIVYIALGKPGRKTEGQIDGKKEERWIYGRLETHSIPGYHAHHHYRRTCLEDGSFVTYSSYYPEYASYYVDTFEVIFVQGRVVGWRQL